MKLLYINPPVDSYKTTLMPLSLLYLSGITRQLCETQILDLKTKHRDHSGLPDVREKMAEYAPDIVGITCLFSGDIEKVLRIAACVKQMAPGTIVMTGGMHPTQFADEIIQNCPDIDIVFLGEGEGSTRKVLTAIIQQSDLSGIDGIVYREYDSKPLLTAYMPDGRKAPYIERCRIRHIEKKDYIHDLETLPAPAYDLFRFEDYFMNTSRWYDPNHIKYSNIAVPVITSRSCPNCCNFCAMNQVMGLQFRARTAESVVEEFNFLYSQYGVNYFYVMDDNFTLNKKRAIDICNGIVSKNLKVALDCLNGLSLNSLDDEVIDALVSAGLVKTGLAIESGSDHIRNDVIGKHLKQEKIYEVVDSFGRHPKVFLNGFFVIGFPEDTEETIQASIDVARELQLDSVSAHPLTPYPGTRVFEQCQREGLFLQDVNIQDLWKRGDLFPDYRNNRFFVKPYKLSIQQLEEYTEQFWLLNEEKRQQAQKRGKCLAYWTEISQESNSASVLSQEAKPGK